MNPYKEEEGDSLQDGSEYLNVAEGDLLDDCFGKEHDPRDISCKNCRSKEECALTFYQTFPEIIEEDLPIALIDLQSLKDELLMDTSNNNTNTNQPLEVKMAKEVPDIAPAGVPIDESALAGITPSMIPPAEVSQGIAAAEAADAKAPKKKAKKEGEGTARRPIVKDPYGFGIGTKGSYIVECLLTGNFTKKELIAAAAQKFGTESSGRVNMVLYQLKKKGLGLVRDQQTSKYKLYALGEAIPESPTQ